MSFIRNPRAFLKLFVLAAALTLAACGDSNSNNAGGPATVSTSDGSLAFSPANITISAGESVTFIMTNTHNAIEVSKETYDAREVTPLPGGFQVDFGQTDEVVFDTPGVYYYVCTPHVTFDMVGTITVR